MKKISLLNPYSFYFLWQNEVGKKFLTDTVNNIIGENNQYELMTLFNNKKNNVRSYVVLESKKTVVFVDYNFKRNNSLFKLDLFMYHYLKASLKKEVKLVIFNDFEDNNNSYNNYYDIYINNDNDDNIKYFFEKSYLMQLRLNKEVTDVLYQMDDEIYDLYLHENDLKRDL